MAWAGRLTHTHKWLADSHSPLSGLQDYQYCLRDVMCSMLGSFGSFFPNLMHIPAACFPPPHTHHTHHTHTQTHTNTHTVIMANWLIQFALGIIGKLSDDFVLVPALGEVDEKGVTPLILKP